MTTRLLLAGLLIAMPLAAMAGSVRLPDTAPVPDRRPEAGLDRTAATTAVRPKPADTAQRTDEPGAEGHDVAGLREGLDALSDGDVGAARAARDRLDDALDRRILDWAIALSGEPAVPSAEIAAAAASLSGWPGAAALRANSERALARENPAPRTVVDAFGQTRPETRQGVVSLARAHVALGDEEAARAVLSPFWRTRKLEAGHELAILGEFGDLIPAADHRMRMERMLHHDRIRSAERVAARAGGEALTRAWAAVIRGENDAADLLAAVPEDERTAGYHFAKARYLRRAEKFSEAAEVILDAPRKAAALADRDAWWIERRVLSRELLDIGEPRTAYRVAAGHAAESAGPIADAEFHAGWYALRELDEPETAARHFARITEVAKGPISLARAHYWLGRAAEAGGPGEAKTHFSRAAAHGTAFYGQLAAARLGRTELSVDYPEPGAEHRQRLGARELVRAIRRLEAAGHERRADLVYLHLAGELGSAGELALLAVMAEERGDHTLALRIGKTAAARGLGIGALAHPVGVIPAGAEIAGAGEALAYAVARQESEFNVSAVSHAGARGLLQLMPGTARDMAAHSGLPYAPQRLTSDAAYNAALGAMYLEHQLDRFDGSYVMAFAGYNAGPSRAVDWAGRYGDPRGTDVDTVVDWIERIPFTETRNYVQRVMENYQVYRMRLSGRFDIEGDLVEGR